jgi:hypothetical protein
MLNHPNRNRALRTEVDGVRSKLSRDAAGNPHALKQWQQDHAGQWHWAIVWAAGHAHQPTGAKAIALHRLCGAWWRPGRAVPEAVGNACGGAMGAPL